MPSTSQQNRNSSSLFASSALRWAAFCVIAILLIGGGVGIWLEMQPKSENRIALFDGKQFTPDELVQIEAALAKKNLSDYTIVNQTLEIPAKSRSAYVAALAEANALPQESGRTLEKTAVEISLFDSPEVRNLKIKAAQQKDLADIINSIEGVSNASVLWDTEKQGGLNPKTIVRASVSLKSVPGYDLDDAKIDAICRLTANAIAGLKTENVVIVDTRTGACYTQNAASSNYAADNADSLDSPERIKDPALAKRLTAERFWNKKISELVRASVDNAIVQTTVEISDCQSETQRRIEHDPEPTIYRSEVIEDLTPAVFGINQPANNSDLNKLVPQPEPTPVIRKTEEGVLGGKEIVTQKSPLAEKSVSVSVVIPMDSIVTLCRNRGTIGYELRPTDAQVIEQTARAVQEKITTVIANILPQPEAKLEPEKFISITFSDAPAPVAGEPVRAAARKTETAPDGRLATAPVTQSDSQNPLAVPNSQLDSPSPQLATRNSQLATQKTKLAVKIALAILTAFLTAYRNELLLALGILLGVIAFTMTLIAVIRWLFALAFKRKTLPADVQQTRHSAHASPVNPPHEKPCEALSPAEALLNDDVVNEIISPSARENRESRIANQENVSEPAISAFHSPREASLDDSYRPEFAFLKDVSPMKLAQILSVERPQATALVLSQIPESAAAQTLSCFSMDYRTQTVERLLHLETPEPEILADIAASVKEQLNSFTIDKANLSNLTNDPLNGMDKLSKIISFSDVQVGQEILESIRQKDKSALEPLYPVGVTFDDLADLDTNSIKTIFDAANPNEFALALVDAKKDVVKNLLAALPEKEQEMYRNQIWFLGPMKLSDVEESRKRIVRLTMDLAVQGKVKLPSRFYSDSLKMRA
ncbi:MAG: hypothetical protein IKX40_03690 [Thermoguttaceae bacterium]|nr:hypothetical protein [Thermoguttaceae bacterium]